MKSVPFAVMFLIAGLAWHPAEAADGKTEPVKPAAENNTLKELWSGYHYASPETRKLQDSDEDNPAFGLVAKGEAIWKEVDGRAGKSCASCHGDASNSMRGAAASYPAYFPLAKKPLTLSSRINLCREKFMQARALPYGSEQLAALSIYVKRQSKGMKISVTGEGPLKPFLDKGGAYFTSRRGQLDISCAGCHERYAGKRYRAAKLSQGHANGFPAYRKAWEATGMLLRQVNQCLARVRANPVRAGSDELTNLELYLAWRASGLEVETPAVRD